MALNTIRWCLNDPAEETRERWTAVHRYPQGGWKTACGLAIPEHAYMTDVDDQVPAGAPRCKRCENTDH